jgi:V/A-type H+-transporting ATPase subunit E
MDAAATTGTANLQGLLERIQKEGVDQAQAEAARILGAARAQAARTLAEAETRAQAVLAKAAQDVARAEAQGRQTIENAARDVLSALRSNIQETVRRLVAGDVKSALRGDALVALVALVVEAYAKSLPAGASLEVLLPPDQQQTIADAVLARVSEAARAGLVIQSDASVVAGFRVSVTGAGVEHDFTAAAISEALCRLVRPQLAERIRAAAKPPA